MEWHEAWMPKVERHQVSVAGVNLHETCICWEHEGKRVELWMPSDQDSHTDLMEVTGAIGVDRQVSRHIEQPTPDDLRYALQWMVAREVAVIPLPDSRLDVLATEFPPMATGRQFRNATYRYLMKRESQVPGFGIAFEMFLWGQSPRGEA